MHRKHTQHTQQHTIEPILIASYHAHFASSTNFCCEPKNFSITAERKPLNYPLLYSCQSFKLSIPKLINMLPKLRRLIFFHSLAHSGRSILFVFTWDRSNSDATESQFWVRRMEKWPEKWISNYLNRTIDFIHIHWPCAEKKNQFMTLAWMMHH